MPLYEYRCTACNRLTEKRQKFSDAELTECPHCGGRLERTITAPAVQFKGGGWYADGYGTKKPAAGGGEAAGSVSGEAKSDSKAEAPAKTEASSSPKAETSPAPAAPAPAAKPAS